LVFLFAGEAPPSATILKGFINERLDIVCHIQNTNTKQELFLEINKKRFVNFEWRDAKKNNKPICIADHQYNDTCDSQVKNYSYVCENTNTVHFVINKVPVKLNGSVSLCGIIYDDVELKNQLNQRKEIVLRGL
jgi:hypothetical protein